MCRQTDKQTHLQYCHLSLLGDECQFVDNRMLDTRGCSVVIHWSHCFFPINTYSLNKYILKSSPEMKKIGHKKTKVLLNSISC